MLFRRRTPLTWPQKFKTILWPRKGFHRLFGYVWQRILRMPGSAYSLAAGAATGVAVSLTPFIGFHILLIVAVCYILRANMLVGFISSLIGNPWTFPFLWLLEINTGKLVLVWLGFEQYAAINGFAGVTSQLTDVMIVWVFGGVVLMTFSWPITFALSFYGIKRWRNYRAIKRALKWQQKQEMQASHTPKPAAQHIREADYE